MADRGRSVGDMRSEPHPLRRGPLPFERRLAEWWGPRPRGVPTVVFVLVWAAVFIAFGVALGNALLAVEGETPLGRLDVDAERWLAAHRSPALDAFTHLSSSLANTTEAVVVGLVLALVAGLVWRRWAEPGMLVIAMVGQLVIHLAVAQIVQRARPPVPYLDTAQPTSSFPSGHTMAAVVLYGSFAVLANERWRGRAIHLLARVVAVLLPTLVAFSRMQRGMHYPTDVVGATLLAGLWLLVSVHAVRIGSHHHAVVTSTRARARTALAPEQATGSGAERRPRSQKRS
jgi:membrane-associated phospholipid phosphatase